MSQTCSIHTISKLFSAFAMITCVFASCNKNCNEADYSFAIKAFIQQGFDSVNVNDTIWLEVDEPTTLRDEYSNKNIDFSNISVSGITLSALKFVGGSVSDPGTVYATDKFNVKVITSSAKANPQSQTLAEVYLSEEANRFRFKCGIIPKDTGTFALGISNGGGVRKENKCEKAEFKFSFANTNQHLYLYQNNRPGYQISQYEADHMYCFKVK
jgi:hypothetical protein